MQFFTQIYVNYFFSSSIEQTGQILVNLWTIAEVMADMKKIYDDLIFLSCTPIVHEIQQVFIAEDV